MVRYGLTISNQNIAHWSSFLVEELPRVVAEYIEPCNYGSGVAFILCEGA